MGPARVVRRAELRIDISEEEAAERAPGCRDDEDGTANAVR
jgi:hypothetical protein